jgi:hypothetical protein
MKLASLLPLLLAALAGGLMVYLYFASRPRSYDEPIGMTVDGVTIWQAAGYRLTRARLAIALGALAACLFFLLGFVLERG